MRPVPGYPGDGHEPARADVLGSVCPHFAHIRKVNPRDGANDLGHPADNLLRMTLRRGIPFGRPLVGVKKPPPGLVKQERGLMFLWLRKLDRGSVRVPQPSLGQLADPTELRRTRARHRPERRPWGPRTYDHVPGAGRSRRPDPEAGVGRADGRRVLLRPDEAGDRRRPRRVKTASGGDPSAFVAAYGRRVRPTVVRLRRCPTS